MNRSRQIYILAIVILAVSIFVPLHEAPTPETDRAWCLAHPPCKIPTVYEYKDFLVLSKSIFTKPVANYPHIWFISSFIVFIVPFLSLALKPKLQAIVISIASIPASFSIYYFFNYVYTTPRIGSFLAILSWVLLLLSSLVTIYQQLPHNKSFKFVRSLCSLHGTPRKRGAP